MAFAVVAATNGGNNNIAGFNHTVNLPGGIIAGHLLIVKFGSWDQNVLGWPGGWTEIFQRNYLGSDDLTFGAAYRIADGGEGATITVTTSTSEKTAHTTYRITNYSDTPECGVAAVGSSANPNPPSLVPSWGAEDTLWLACCGYNLTAGLAVVNTYPTNYTDGLNNLTDTNIGCGVGSARRELNASPEDPGVFTLNYSRDWIANTIAIRPLGGGGGGIADKSANMGGKMIGEGLI